MIAGGAMIVLGSLLPWFELHANPARLGGVGGEVSRSIRGTDTSDGTLFLVIGVVVLVLGAVAFVVPGGGPRFAMALIGALGAFFVGGFALYDALTPRSQAIDAISSELGPVGTEARRFVEGLFDRGYISIGTSVGLWLVVLGAVAALVGTVLSALAARSVPTSPPSGAGEAHATGPAMGWSADAGAGAPSSEATAPAAWSSPGDDRAASPDVPAAPMSPPDPPAGPVSEDRPPHATP
jgi:hypothetical protein